MNIQILNKIISISFAAMLTATGTANASETAPSVLDYQDHPRSPEHSDIYVGDLLSLDATLSWTNRFNGDETFNQAEMLPQSIISSSTMTHDKSNMMQSMGTMTMDGLGVIKTIRPEQGKVKIQHGPIEKYGMPEMTMVFKVDDPSMLEDLDQGQEVGFNVDNSSGGFVVTHIMSMQQMENSMAEQQGTTTTSGMDARGMVKAVRLSQGKVKIEHGEIDKYGMPAMTMMFKVTDPALLEGLEQGTEVEFDVDNSSGGFEITNIKSISE